MKLVIRCLAWSFIFSITITLSPPRPLSNGTACVDMICPWQCSVGLANGCELCTCPPGVSPIPRTSVHTCSDVICPGQCSVGLANGCQTCTCPPGISPIPRPLLQTTTPKCPDIVCPGQCYAGFANGCRTCACPIGVSPFPLPVQPANTTKCPDVVCPSQCSVGFANGCQTCSCPPGITPFPRRNITNEHSKNCTEIVCPGECSLGFRDGCRTCTCPNGFNVTKGCPEIVCPGRCSVGFVNGCRTCNCPVEVNTFLRSPPPSCDEKTPCTGANEECAEFGICLCATGYTKAGKVCVSTPTLGDDCIINGEPVYCDGYGVHIECNLVKGSDYGKCVCKPGFKIAPLEQICRPIEIVLGQSCTNDRDCVIAYSYCSTEMKCTCIPGFVRDNSGLCLPPSFACPSFNDGVNFNKAGFECEVYYDPETSQEFNTCKANEFCYQHPKSRTSQGRYVGHCCARPPNGLRLGLVCPLAISYNGTCPDTSDLPMDAVAPPDKIATCPFTTHDCIRQPLRKDEICCPLPCRASSSHFAVNGLCHDYVLLGQPCKHTAQCIAGSECSQSTCQCKFGFKQVSLTQCALK